MLRVRVLGTLGVEHDGRPLDVPGGLPKLVVAYLALHPGQRPRRKVAESLWPDAPSGDAGRRLRTALWEAQRPLTPVAQPLIDASRRDIGLHAAVSVDLSEARALLDAGAPELALTLLDGGLADELDQEWAVVARIEALALRLAALRAAAHHAADVGSAAAYAHRRIALDPLSEDAHRDLIRLLAQFGDRAAATAAYEQMRRVLAAELGIGPSVESRRLLAQLSAEDLALPEPAAPRPHRRAVPAATTPLVGRDPDIALVAAALESDRLVTIVGPGGVGKSRVAFAVAQQRADRGHPVAVAELATTPRADACDYVVAAALGVHVAPGRALRDAMVYRLTLEAVLLVLDNCEHVREAMRELVAHLLRWSAGVHVLVTSREPLALPGELVLRLSPLAVPADGDSDDVILASPAVQLLARAARWGSHPVTPAGDLADLARLARRLDGLPLALELAGPRIASLGVQVLEQRLRTGLDALSAGPSGTTRGRHDSLLDALEWSLTMLSPNERTLLGLLSLLPGPFPMGAAHALLEAAHLMTDPVVGLARLVEASLVQVHRDDVWCYSQLETIRLLGGRLLDDQTAVMGRTGLVQWAVRFADTVRRDEYDAEIRVHTEMVQFLPLVRAALHDARAGGDVESERRIVTGIEGWGTWREQPEVWVWVSELAAHEPHDNASDNAGDPSVDLADADVLRMGAVSAWRLGRMDVMREFTGRCVAADPTGAQGPTAAAALMLLAFAERRWAEVPQLAAPALAAGGDGSVVTMTVVATAQTRAGELDAGLNTARAARRHAERLRAPSLNALALLAEARAWAAWHRGGADGRADAMLAEARALADSVGAAELVASIDKERGRQALRRGYPERAVGPLRDACLHWLGTGNTRPMKKAFEELVESLVATGRADAASRLSRAQQRSQLTGPLLASITPLEERAPE